MTSAWGAIGLLSRNFLAVLMSIQHLTQLCRVPGPVEERDPVTSQGDQSCDHQGWGYKGSVTALEREKRVASESYVPPQSSVTHSLSRGLDIPEASTGWAPQWECVGGPKDQFCSLHSANFLKSGNRVVIPGDASYSGEKVTADFEDERL